MFRRSFLIVVSLSLTGLGLMVVPTKLMSQEQVRKSGYTFKLAKPHKSVELRFGKYIFGGFLDQAGNFNSTEKPIIFGQSFTGGSAPVWVMINVPKDGKSEPAYEYRSGMLIVGELRAEVGFVPTEGSKIINFKDFQYTPDAPRIYNLPGDFVKSPN